MILADTIWVDHLGRDDEQLAGLLATMTQLDIAEYHDVLRVIDDEALHGTGIGYVDAHLLTSTLLMPGIKLWTRDKRLRAAAQRLGVGATGE